MRHGLVVLLALAALLAAPSGAARAPSASDVAAERAGLRVVAWAPLKLRGTGFEPRERVRVTALVHGTRSVRRAVATAAGSFTAAFATTVLDRCGLVAFAAGDRGSRASVKLPQTACPPPLAP